jgi:hypothetical protein
MKIYKLIPIFVLILTGCTRPQQPEVIDSAPVNIESQFLQATSATPDIQPKPISVASPTPTPVPPEESELSPTPPPIEKPVNADIPPSSDNTAVLGPDQFSLGINPLTGLPVDNPDLLSLPPALISITNFPVSARPQAGLSFASYVYELYIGEGMTRFLALFYGQYPHLTPQNKTDTTVATNNQAEIGPVRSGRLPYQAIRRLYNGFLVMASASSEVTEATTDFTNIFGSDSNDINSALLDVTRLESIAEANKTELEINLTGNLFEGAVPEGGQDASSLWVFYNFLNQVKWEFNHETGAYLRFQDNADGSGTFFPATDRLTGEQLAFENVILLFVKHRVLNSQKTLIDVDLLYSEGYAYLFRDGKVYPIYWTTVGDEYEKTTGRLRPIRFTDRVGNPIPLKPGSTWVELVDLTTVFSEIQPGSWKARFYAP